MNRTGLWIAAVVVAAALGWTAAMVVQSGASLRDEQDAYLRFANALAVRDAIDRTELLVKLTRKLTPETLPGAIRAFRDDLHPREAADIRLLMAFWAKHEPRQMIEQVQSWPDTRVQRLAAAQATYEIAQSEGYEAARAFYDALPTHQRDSALNNLVLSLIDFGEVEDLAGLITSFEIPDERETVAKIALHRMIRTRGPEAVQQWVESLPPGRGSSSDLKRVAFRAAQSAHLDNDHRDDFLAWMERVGDVFWTKGAWRSVAVHWVRTDPMAGIAWAETLSEERERDDVVAEAIRIFAVRDVARALPWILEQPPAEKLDRGTGRLAVHFAMDRPALSLELMERIVSDTTYRNTRRSVEHRWNMLPAEPRAKLRQQSKELARARFLGEDAGGDEPDDALDADADPSDEDDDEMQ